MKTLRASARHPGGRGLDPHCVVLRDAGPDSCQRYVVHTKNLRDGGHTSGTYSDDLDRAQDAYRARCDRYGLAHGADLPAEVLA